MFITIGALIILIILTIIGYLGGVVFLWLGEVKHKAWVITLSAITVLLAVIWGATIWYYQCTAAGQRALKTQRSELGDGIQREVTVYDMQGDILDHYEGKFDVDTDSDGSVARILFDDEEGNRHIIYPGGGIVIITEVGGTDGE